MFRQEEQERIPEALAKIFKKLEQDLFDDIVKRISISKEISRTTDYELYRLAQLRSYDYDLKERIRQALDESNKTIDSMFDKVIEEGYAHDRSLYEDAGFSFTPLNENPVMLQLMKAVKEATKDEIENMSQTVGFLTENFGKSQFEDATTYFRNKLNETMLAMATGAYSYDAALKKTVTELCNSGIRTVSYESGRHDRVDVAVRRATLTGLAKITGKIAEQNAEALKTDYFEVSAHPTARPSHMLWQGRVYTKEQLKTICGLGDVTGLCGANCYHHYDAFIPGISKRAYTDEQLNKMYEDSLVSKEFNGKKYTLYEATQYQRALERSMRVQDEKIRLLKQGDGSHEDLMIMKMRRRNTYETYKKLSKTFGLPEHMQRVFTLNKPYDPMPKHTPVKSSTSSASLGSTDDYCKDISKNWESINSIKTDASKEIHDQKIFVDSQLSQLGIKEKYKIAQFSNLNLAGLNGQTIYLRREDLAYTVARHQGQFSKEVYTKTPSALTSYDYLFKEKGSYIFIKNISADLKYRALHIAVRSETDAVYIMHINYRSGKNYEKSIRKLMRNGVLIDKKIDD